MLTNTSLQLKIIFLFQFYLFLTFFYIMNRYRVTLKRIHIISHTRINLIYYKKIILRYLWI